MTNSTNSARSMSNFMRGKPAEPDTTTDAPTAGDLLDSIQSQLEELRGLVDNADG